MSDDRPVIASQKGIARLEARIEALKAALETIKRRSRQIGGDTDNDIRRDLRHIHATAERALAESEKS